ncbi:MAG: hypothetical protein ABIC39_08140 [Pseudomonadota bacterium]
MEVNGKLNYQIVDTISGLEDITRSLKKEKSLPLTWKQTLCSILRKKYVLFR